MYPITKIQPCHLTVTNLLQMLTVNSQGTATQWRKPGVARPYVVHPDYPHYGDLAPPFNVSADSIIYMDLDELDYFFLRQKRKPEVGFTPDPDKDYTPMITKLYQPQTLKQNAIKNPATFQPINSPVASSKPNNHFTKQPNDSMTDTSSNAHDIIQTPRDRDLQSPGSSQFASPMSTPTHRTYDPASSITSTPSHAGYMTPPQDIVEMRRSSASPHLDNYSMASRTFETDVWSLLKRVIFHVWSMNHGPSKCRQHTICNFPAKPHAKDVRHKCFPVPDC